MLYLCTWQLVFGSNTVWCGQGKLLFVPYPREDCVGYAGMEILLQELYCAHKLKLMKASVSHYTGSTYSRNFVNRARTVQSTQYPGPQMPIILQVSYGIVVFPMACLRKAAVELWASTSRSWTIVVVAAELRYRELHHSHNYTNIHMQYHFVYIWSKGEPNHILFTGGAVGSRSEMGLKVRLYVKLIQQCMVMSVFNAITLTGYHPNHQWNTMGRMQAGTW